MSHIIDSDQPPFKPAVLEDIYRQHSRSVFATLVRLLGDFDQAEEALHEAFKAAMEQWPHKGVPLNPVAWLVSAGRFKTIDQLRRLHRFISLDEHSEFAELLADDSASIKEAEVLDDDQLRLVFTCCHPSLSPDAQTALTLREVCGLTTEEIARAFLLPASTLAQRIVRAKAKIRDARIPYEVPEHSMLAERLESVLRVIYLVFNEAYSASSGEHHTRSDLSTEAIRLARLLHVLLPVAEVKGLLALMLLHESRRVSRSTSEGDLIALEEQDRKLWNVSLISEGKILVEAALRSGQFGSYCLQAAISAVHAEAKTAAETDWRQIVGLYDVLLRMQPSPIIELNRAIAIAMRDGPEQGLSLIDGLLLNSSLKDYHLAYAARADLCRRLGRHQEAIKAYEQALALTQQAPEQRFLLQRLAQLSR
jgi:RNA polymerase sigma-70 factor, ECF subfamily